MTDHAAEARRNLAVAEAGDWEKDYGPSLEHMALMAAQVHATLALAEQQRIANIIALATPQGVPGQSKATISIPSYGIDGILRADIASALGLTPTTPNQEQPS